MKNNFTMRDILLILIATIFFHLNLFGISKIEIFGQNKFIIHRPDCENLRENCINEDLENANKRYFFYQTENSKEIIIIKSIFSNCLRKFKLNRKEMYKSCKMKMIFYSGDSTETIIEFWDDNFIWVNNISYKTEETFFNIIYNIAISLQNEEKKRQIKLPIK